MIFSTHKILSRPRARDSSNYKMPLRTPKEKLWTTRSRNTVSHFELRPVEQLEKFKQKVQVPSPKKLREKIRNHLISDKVWILSIPKDQYLNC